MQSKGLKGEKCKGKPLGNRSPYLAQKNPMKNTFLLPFAVILVLLTSACREDVFCDDPANFTCPNFDPCTRSPPANSDFKIVAPVEFVADTTIEIEIDTSVSGGTTYYKANVTRGLKSYAWKVGTDPQIFTGPELTLDFTGFVGAVSVTLETTADSTSTCLDESQFRDVKTKQIYYTDHRSSAPVFGTFKGTLQGTPDEEYEVRVDNSHPPFSRLHGLPVPPNCDFNERGIPLYRGYQFFVSTFLRESSTSRCRNLIVVGRINLEDSNELRIEYVYDDDEGKRKEVTFVGQRQ
jgi:hypothetical protein